MCDLISNGLYNFGNIKRESNPILQVLVFQNDSFFLGSDCKLHLNTC